MQLATKEELRAQLVTLRNKNKALEFEVKQLKKQLESSKSQ